MEVDLHVLVIRAEIPPGTPWEIHKKAVYAPDGPFGLPPAEKWRGDRPIIEVCPIVQRRAKPPGVPYWGEGPNWTCCYRQVYYGRGGMSDYRKFRELADSAGTCIHQIGRFRYEVRDFGDAWVSYFLDLSTSNIRDSSVACKRMSWPMELYAEYALDGIEIYRILFPFNVFEASARAIDTILTCRRTDPTPRVETPLAPEGSQRDDSAPEPETPTPEDPKPHSGASKMTPGARAVAAAYQLQSERKPVSIRAACELAGVDRVNLRKNYPDEVKIIEALSAPVRNLRRGARDARTGGLDAIDD